MSLLKRKCKRPDAEAGAAGSPSRRRRFQFTLRRLAIVVALACGALAMWIRDGQGIEHRAKAVGKTEGR